MNVADLLAGRRVCVCAGPGGVGKTTTSAAVALGMAARGAKVAVVTIDPARRLANALGLQELSNEPALVPRELLEQDGLKIAGELWAMMLDPKRTFDELIDRNAPTAERAAEIKSNRVYEQLSTAVSGSQEFTAVSKLYELVEQGDFDLIVLDTPPSRSAMDFFDAPNRLTAFLEGRALQTFLRPTSFGMRVLGIGVGPVLAGLRKVTGVDLIGDLTTFFGLLGDMTETFSLRAKRVDELLHADETAFLIVSSARSWPVDEAIHLHTKLRAGGMRACGGIVNRYHPPAIKVDRGKLTGELTQVLGQPLAEAVSANYADYAVLAASDALNVQRLREQLGDDLLLLVPQFDQDVHDVGGLLHVHQHLFG